MDNRKNLTEETPETQQDFNKRNLTEVGGEIRVAQPQRVLTEDLPEEDEPTPKTLEG